MKKILILLTVLLLALACTPAEPMEMDHLGCQEDEIDKDGTCLPAENNNVQLFAKDVSNVVATQVMNEPVKGYLAQPKEEGNYPGVVMIHEWWGLNDNIKTMAEQLAAQGYIVYAVDLYDGQVAQDSTKARELASAVRSNPQEAITKLKAVNTYLKQTATKTASLGWCFGGQQSLQLSLNDDLDATVIYYGNLETNQEALQSVSGPVLGIFGSEDSGIPVATVNEFQAALDELEVENDINIYEGVGHAFANPTGSNYAADETKDAWQKTLAFLEKNLK